MLDKMFFGGFRSPATIVLCERNPPRTIRHDKQVNAGHCPLRKYARLGRISCLSTYKSLQTTRAQCQPLAQSFTYHATHTQLAQHAVGPGAEMIRNAKVILLIISSRRKPIRIGTKLGIFK